MTEHHRGVYFFFLLNSDLLCVSVQKLNTSTWLNYVQWADSSALCWHSCQLSVELILRSNRKKINSFLSPKLNSYTLFWKHTLHFLMWFSSREGTLTEYSRPSSFIKTLCGCSWLCSYQRSPGPDGGMEGVGTAIGMPIPLLPLFSLLLLPPLLPL